MEPMSYLLYFAILTKEFISSKHLLFCNGWRKTDDIDEWVLNHTEMFTRRSTSSRRCSCGIEGFFSFLLLLLFLLLLDSVKGIQILQCSNSQLTRTNRLVWPRLQYQSIFFGKQDICCWDFPWCGDNTKHKPTNDGLPGRNTSEKMNTWYPHSQGAKLLSVTSSSSMQIGHTCSTSSSDMLSDVFLEVMVHLTCRMFALNDQSKPGLF